MTTWLHCVIAKREAELQPTTSHQARWQSRAVGLGASHAGMRCGGWLSLGAAALPFSASVSSPAAWIQRIPMPL